MDEEFTTYLRELRGLHELTGPALGPDETKYGWLLAYAKNYTLAQASVIVDLGTDMIDKYLAMNAVKWVNRGASVTLVLRKFPCSTGAFIKALKDNQKTTYMREGELIANIGVCARRLSGARDGNPLRADIIRTRKEALIELREVLDELEELGC